MKNVTILHTTSDNANFALAVVATTLGIATALYAKKRISKAVYEFVAGPA